MSLKVLATVDYRAALPVGGYAAIIKLGGRGGIGAWRNLYLLPSSPLGTEEAAAQAQIDFDPGLTPAEATWVARQAAQP